MANTESKARHGEAAGVSIRRTRLLTSGLTLETSHGASRGFADSPERMKVLLQGYGEALARSRISGRRVSFRVDVDPEGSAFVTPVDERAVEGAGEAGLPAALAAARVRGRLRAAEILAGADMLSADDFARRLGTSRVTVNAKRRSGQILGLDGAKRGFRFPDWQLDAQGLPYAALAALHERLGGNWAVYRFLVQPQGALDGLTGREALERGRAAAALGAAEMAGSDFL